MSTINARLATRLAMLRTAMRDDRGDSVLTFVMITAGVLLFALVALAAFTKTGQKYVDQISNEK